jgi:L,D-peptidoglycan transpeptidase YkuD (ErfK/YbiS/YcfS/YnhG family)
VPVDLPRRTAPVTPARPGRPGRPARSRARLLVAAFPLLLVAALAGCGADASGSEPPASPIATPQPGRPTAAPSDPGTAGVASGPAAGPATSGPPAPTTAAARPTTAGPAQTRGTESTPEKTDPGRFRSLPANTTQVVIVQSASPTATTATLQSWTKSGGTWRAAGPAVAARLGGNGFSEHKREGDRTTPAGVFAIDATMYYAYHQLAPDDWWDENSDSPGYNTFSHGPNPGGPSEPLWQISPQYTYFGVIRYNMPATAGRGSGIFLHQGNGNSTLGCVSLPQGDLLAVLRWLDPAANPRIVMAPTAWLGRY